MLWKALAQFINDMSTTAAEEQRKRRATDRPTKNQPYKDEAEKQRQEEEGSILVGSTRFDYIQGWRGFLCLLVVYAHIAKFYSKIDVSSTNTLYMAMFVVCSFFIMSAYFLTRRCLSEMFELKARKDLTRNERKRELMLLILVFFIRRAFRLYVPYFIVCTFVSFGPKFLGGIYVYETGKLKGDYQPWSQLVLLQPTGINHYWTVAVEFRYYFFIPPICYLFYTAGLRYFNALICLCILFAYYMFSWLGKLSKKELESHFFWSKFPIFFVGSLFAIIMFRLNEYIKEFTSAARAKSTSSYLSNPFVLSISKNFRSTLNLCFQIIQHKVFKFICGLLVLILYAQGFRHFSSAINPRSQHIVDHSMLGLYLIVLFALTFLGVPNFLTYAFSDNYLFITAGRFSLGIYLLHPICLLLKPLYYDELARAIELRRGEGADEMPPTTLEMGIITFMCVYFVGFLFYYLIENPCIKYGDYLVDRVREYYRGGEQSKFNKQSPILLL